MFSIKEKLENGFDKIVICDENSRTEVEVIPACGALLHSFAVLHKGAMLNLVDHYADANEFKNKAESLGFKSCKLSPFVCRMKNGRYHFGETDHTIEKFYLGKNAIHGLVYDALFTVTEVLSTNENATVTMRHQYQGEDKGYPFNYDCLISYELKKENTLTVTTEIINKDLGSIPIADGWHPYFSFGSSINDLQLEFQSREILEFDEDLVPTGKLIPYQEFGSLKNIEDVFFDNCFTVNFAECQPMVVLRDSSQQLQLEIHPDKSYPYLQIYTPPHRKSIAIENLSAAPDTFNNTMGIITLTPGENALFKTTYKITSLT